MEAKLQTYRKWLETAELNEQKYQIDGLQWLIQRESGIEGGADGRADGGTEGFKRIHGGILADEMGLGKTIQMLGLILCNTKHRSNQQTLIVVPPSLLHQWEHEIKRLLGHQVLVYHGVRKRRIYVDALSKAPVVLTTYGGISPKLIEEDYRYNALFDVKWHRVIYDEAHHLRNHKTKKHIGACNLQTHITWLVTGTPINNRISDLFHLCSILKINKSFYNADGVKEIVKNVVLKRTKKSIGINMPKLSITNVVIGWDNSLEEEMADTIHSMVSLTTPTTANIKHLTSVLGQYALAIYIRMKQMCVMPTLLQKNFDAYIKKNDIDSKDFPIIFGLYGNSKLNAVFDKIRGRISNGRSKIIFCNYRREIDWLQTNISDLGYKCGFIDGRVCQRERKEMLADTSYDVLILQIRTACEGLNLQHYQEVYFTSPHWNPFVEDQAVARCHRLGQMSDVEVFKFEMEGFASGISFDMYCNRVQQVKREIEDSLFSE